MTNLVFWLGAGISIPPPTSLPSAQALVKAWLRYLLPCSEAERIETLYQRYAHLIGKSIPRLEKLVEDARWAFGKPVLELLSFCSDASPNGMHWQIVDYLRANKGWAITTNFDDALEQAANGLLPVLAPSRSTADHEWGLIKLHGDIKEPLSQLGHSIANLTQGIAPPGGTASDFVAHAPSNCSRAVSGHRTRRRPYNACGAYLRKTHWHLFSRHRLTI